jgi:site-specific DNA-methyltransferase (adenine-specific)
MRWRSRTKRIEADEALGLFGDDASGNGSHANVEANKDLDAIPDLDSGALTEARDRFERDGCSIQLGDSLQLCKQWPAPTMISVDGPYGVGGFDGDPYSPEELAEWYEPHIAAWSEKATALTTLWFWNTEIGWAHVHPVLAKHGWSYRGATVWDKGIAHIAGNVNTGVLRKLPITTELCVHYVKDPSFVVDGRKVSMKEWLKYEWLRTGMPLYLTNEACDVKNAATRKYFTQCRLWYYPPVEVFEKFVRYANEKGDPKGRPYFSIDGKAPMTGEEWESMRAKFTLEHGLTNVWQEPAVRGGERIKNGMKAIHTNQKPRRLIDLTVRLCTEESDVVWEPFGGLCTTAIACHHLKRQCYASEVNPDFFRLAVSRLARYDR